MTPTRLSLLILAGPNGCGKTTIADFMVRSGKLGLFLNADLIARGLENDQSNGGQIESGRVMLERLHTAIQSKTSISFETTLSGRTWLRLISDAKRQGFEITICYVAVNSPNLAIARVENRVREGGHFVPAADIERRYHRSLGLFWKTYMPLVDNWYFFDNSESSAVLVAYREMPAQEVVLNKVIFESYQAADGY